MDINGKPKKTPLYQNHRDSGAKVIDFAGWMLPVQYTSIIKEHLHTRQYCSVFDICHMGEFYVSGESAAADLSRILTVNASLLKDGRCKYGFILNEAGCFIDDMIVYRFSSDSFMLVVNASRIKTDSDWIKNHISSNTSFEDVSEVTAKIDLQGPLSILAASSAFPQFDFQSLKSFSFSKFECDGYSVTVSATGYTGEAGFEFFMPTSAAEQVWKRLLENSEVKPAGLGARDSLRLEKGYSLYGHDITDRITPYEANLSRFINLNNKFIGSEKLKELSESKPERIIVPFLCEGRRTARDNYKILKDGKEIGVVTSGAYSPSLQRGIGLCLINFNSSKAGTQIICIDDKIEIKAVITELPFI